MQQMDYSRIKNIVNEVDLDVNERPGAKLTFPIWLDAEYMNYDISVLGLNQRAYNCLKRININTVKDLITNIHCSSDLKKVRNCGVKSAKEIMDALFAYQFECLSETEKIKFFELLIEMNSR